MSRFATIIDRRNADEWTPLSDLTEDQAKFHVYDSLLSEYAALGFEYGYSVARPEALVLWEAQFGDFVNGAQTVIDEFISAGETKWRQESGVVLLLPHGYEGQGPDHSSARIERFLTMGADEAFVVAQPSTPASYFHLLRQHSLGEAHRPLIVFTPKSMLKRKEAASQPADFTEGSFRAVHRRLGADPEKVDTLLLCSGRVTWDLMVERGKRENGERFAIGRVEQLYPRPEDGIRHEIGRYPQPQGGALGAGRAAQHGPVAALPAQPLAAPRRRGQPRHPGGVLLAVGRHGQAAHRPSRRTCSTGRSPELGGTRRVLHRPRHRGAASRAVATRRSPSRGWPSSCRPSSTSTRSSRTPSSGWPPGWPGSTTPTTS